MQKKVHSPRGSRYQNVLGPFVCVQCFGCVLFILVPCLWIQVLFCFSFVGLYVYAYGFRVSSKVYCRSALGPLPGYLIIVSLVCVPDEIGGLAVRRHNKPKTNKIFLNQKPKKCSWCTRRVSLSVAVTINKNKNKGRSQERKERMGIRSVITSFSVKHDTCQPCLE